MKGEKKVESINVELSKEEIASIESALGLYITNLEWNVNEEFTPKESKKKWSDEIAFVQALLNKFEAAY